MERKYLKVNISMSIKQFLEEEANHYKTINHSLKGNIDKNQLII